jgi:hypothetical protein
VTASRRLTYVRHIICENHHRTNLTEDSESNFC